MSINGTQVLTNFDIFATAGGKDKAVQETFTATADANGQIAVAFNYGSSGYPQVNGIEVLSAGVPVQQINCGELAGGTITINPSTFTNQGTLAATEGTLAIHTSAAINELGQISSTLRRLSLSLVTCWVNDQQQPIHSRGHAALQWLGHARGTRNCLR